MAREERSEVFIGAITFIKIFQLDNIEVLLGVEEFVCIATIKAAVLIALCIPLGKVMLDEKH